MKILEIIIGCSYFGGIERFLDNTFGTEEAKQHNIDFLFISKNSLKKIINKTEYPNYSFYEMKLTLYNTDYFSVKQYIKIPFLIKNFLKGKEYDAIHIHAGSVFVIGSILFGVSSRNTIITHTHAQYVDGKLHGVKYYIRLITKWILQKYIKTKSNYLLGCSQVACESTFGTANKNYIIVNNPILIDDFLFEPSIRSQIRNQNDDCIVLGTVGRLAEVKNQLFLIDVFGEICKQHNNYFLWIVGSGELFGKLKEKTIRLGLQDRVVFWGERDDVNILLQGMDIFLMPSIKEGFGLAAVEAQISGMPTIVSDTVPSVVKVTDNICYLSLNDSATKWANVITDMSISTQTRVIYNVDDINTRFSCQSIFKTLISLYNDEYEAVRS